MIRLLQRLSLGLLALASFTTAWAHKPSDSYLTLRAQDNGRIEARWDIALRDLDEALQLDRDANGELTWSEIRTRAADITALATRHLQLGADHQPCTWQPPAAPLQLDRHSDGTYAVLQLTAQCPGLTKTLPVRYSLFFDFDPTHRGLVQWQPPGSATSQALVFSTSKPTQELALSAPSPWDTLAQYFIDGVWHIWIGFDHILFLIALLLPAVLVVEGGRWRPVDRLRPAVVEVTKVVTAFTLAHSITLSLAALQWVTLPSRLVESVIAASVVVAALANLFPRAGHRRWPMAFGFGLIHGFGFASVLADLGLPDGTLALALVGFNLGVEVGQLAIVLVFLPTAFALRASQLYQRIVLAVGSAIIAALAGWWFAERAFF